MFVEHSSPYSIHLCRYTIASADMYYAEVEVRDVILKADELGNFCIVGETRRKGTSVTVELCELFLEYAMYCRTWWDAEDALYQMQDFAQHIGHSAGQFLKRYTGLGESDHPGNCALEGLFQALHSHISIDYMEGVEHVVALDCPLEKAATHSGCRDIELAHYGINILCQSLIEAIDPEVAIKTTPQLDPEFDITILKPEFA